MRVYLEFEDHTNIKLLVNNLLASLMFPSPSLYFERRSTISYIFYSNIEPQHNVNICVHQPSEPELRQVPTPLN